MIQRGGEVVIKMLANVKKTTMEPIIKTTVADKSLIFTDEYGIYHGVKAMDYEHQTVCHSDFEYARDEDGDGFYEVHVNTMEGFWSLLRSWLRPHCGISQEKLPLYLGFFECLHNLKKGVKAQCRRCYLCYLAKHPKRGKSQKFNAIKLRKYFHAFFYRLPNIFS